MLKILDTGINTAEVNMRLDAKLLADLLPDGDPILHLYRWEGPSATYGYFLDPARHLCLEKAEKHRLSLAKRPTGGGIVFHIWDLAFSFLMPSGHPRFSQNTLENYRFVNEAVKEAMKDLLQTRDLLELIPQDAQEGCSGFCMGRPTIYDVVCKGRKIAGAAQRRRKNGYLHQGTISLALPHTELLADVLLSREEVIRAMMAYSFAPLGRYWEAAELQAMREELQKRLAENLKSRI